MVRFIGGVLIGVLLGYWGAQVFVRENVSFDEVGELTNKHDLLNYRYTNELLACGDIPSLSVGRMEGLKKELEQVIAKRSKNISLTAVYIRDLDNGPWLGINEKEFFYPASLLKLPLLLAAYKEEERVPGFLDRTVRFEKPAAGMKVLFPPKDPIVPGERYSIRELVRRAIVFSDNEAALLVSEAIGFKRLTEAFTDLGIKTPVEGEDYQMRVRTYASFFRILYNASYLTRDHSEEALAILAEADFNYGIAAGIPQRVPFAHKFGEREMEMEGGKVQLHDCGIIYAPQKPFLLCVMAQGESPEAILEMMRDVARESYETLVD